MIFFQDQWLQPKLINVKRSKVKLLNSGLIQFQTSEFLVDKK